MKTKQLKWLLGLLAIVTMIAVGVMIGMTPESLQAKKSSEIEKTTEKANVSTQEETLPEVAGQPRVVYPPNDNIPIVSRDEISDLDLIQDPTFKNWTNTGIPTGWQHGGMFGTTPAFYYEPGDVYQPQNYDQTIIMYNSKLNSILRAFTRWQRIKDGGMIASTASAQPNVTGLGPNSYNFTKEVKITPDNGAVFFMDANVQKAHLDFVSFPDVKTIDDYYENLGVVHGFLRLQTMVESGEFFSTFEFTDTADKVKALNENLNVQYTDYNVLSSDQLKKLVNSSKTMLQWSAKGIYKDGDTKPNSFYYNAMQFNYLSLYTMDLMLNINQTPKEIPLGSDFGSYFSKADFVNAVTSAEYAGVDENGNVTRELVDPSTLDFRGIVEEYPDTSSIGEKTFRVYFKAKNSAGKTIRGIAPMKVNVVWNKALSLGSNNTNSFGDDASATAFSLIQQPGGQYEIVSTYGNASSIELPLQDTGSDTYYQVDLYKKPASGTLALTEDLNNKGYASLTAKGDNTPAQLMNAWGGKNDGRQAVSIGDILRVYIANPARELVRDGETITFRADDAYRGEYVFYEVTTDGFKPLYLNQVKGKTNIPAYHNETIAQITADFKAHKDNYIETMPTGTYTGVSWDGSFKTANSPDTSVAEKKNVPGILTLGATMVMGSYTLTVGDFTITPTFDIGKAGVEPPEPEEQWELVLNSNILKEFDVGAAEPSNTTIKDWFQGQVNFKNVATGDLLYSGGNGLSRSNFSVELLTTWNSKTAGTFPYAVKITVTSVPSSITGKLVSNTMTTSGNQLQIEFTGGQPQVGGDITVEYYVDGNKMSSTPVKGGEVGTYATIPAYSDAAKYDFEKAVLPDGSKVNTWPLTNKVKFTAAAQTVKVYYTTKTPPASTDVTVKVTMVDPDGNALLFPPGTTNPLELLNSDDTVFTNKSTISSSTVTFDKKIVKGNSYKIKQLKEIPNYNNYAGDLLIGVAEGGGLIIDGMPRPPSAEWSTEQQGISMKFTKDTDTLEVKVKLTKAIKYKLSVDTQTIPLWAGDPIRTPAELKEIFRGHIKAVEDKTPVSPGIELSDSQYSLEITSNWVNTVTPVGSPRSFTVKVTPTQAAINEYPGLATLSGEYLKVNFKEITYELQATGVPHEYWSNDPQPNADERLTWVEDVKILPSNTPDTTDTTATKVEITGFKDGGTTKPTTEVDMTKLGETIYLVTVTAKNQLNKDTEITRENVEVPITIVAPPTYELKINVVDTDGKPINYEDVSAPFGYTLDGKDNWDTTATTAENVITFTNKLDIQSKYQIEQSDVLQPNTEETSEELPNDTSVVFPPESGIKPPGLTQELHTKTLTETYPWNEQKASLAFVISRDESTLSYGSKTYDTDTENPIELADGLKAKYNKGERILELTVTNDQGELSLAVPDLIFQQGTPGIMKEQLLERKENAKDPWKVKIKDTLQTNQMWSLEAKLTEPFTLTGENREIKDILVYKETPTSAQQLMVLDQAMPILDKTSAGAPNTEQFYEKTWEKQAGFLLSVDKQKSMGIKGGVYTAALEFTLKDAD